MLLTCGKFTNHEINQEHYQNEIDKSMWRQHLERCLEAALHVATVLDKQCEPTLIHCSDGWDRTAQLTSLGQIILDPFYRTTVCCCCCKH